jgi:hypothetical protein
MGSFGRWLLAMVDRPDKVGVVGRWLRDNPDYWAAFMNDDIANIRGNLCGKGVSRERRLAVRGVHSAYRRWRNLGGEFDEWYDDETGSVRKPRKAQDGRVPRWEVGGSKLGRWAK